MPSAVQYKLLAALGTQLSRQLKVGEELPSVLRVALLAFGRLRTYTKNLQPNLQVLRSHLLHSDIVDVYVLTERSSQCYSQQNEREVVDLFSRFSFNVVKLW